MKETYESYILKISLDTIVPLDNGIYKISERGIHGISLGVKNNFEVRKKIGSFEVHGDVHMHQGHGCGESELELTYYCDSPLSIDQFSQKMSINPIWHMSSTGWDFALEDINRIIDLYRYLANAYWWHHVSMWNVNELNIYGKSLPEKKLKFISQSSSPKALKFGGKPFDDIAYNKDSDYITNLKSGTEIPFYFLMYLNGRRSYSEHSYREALINWANCIESYAIHLLIGACKITGISQDEQDKLLEPTNEYKQRYSKAYEILSRNKIYPEIKKKQAMKLIKNIMEYRNDVMHGNNPDINWETIGKKQQDVEKLLTIAPELRI